MPSSEGQKNFVCHFLSSATPPPLKKDQPLLAFFRRHGQLIGRSLESNLIRRSYYISFARPFPSQADSDFDEFFIKVGIWVTLECLFFGIYPPVLSKERLLRCESTCKEVQNFVERANISMVLHLMGTSLQESL